MTTDTSPYYSQYFKQLYSDGMAEGEAKALLTMLGARGFDVPATLIAEIEACTDHARLTEWITRAGHLRHPRGDLRRRGSVSVDEAVPLAVEGGVFDAVGGRGA